MMLMMFLKYRGLKMDIQVCRKKMSCNGLPKQNGVISECSYKNEPIGENYEIKVGFFSHHTS